MTSDAGKWDVLETIQRSINKLEKRRQQLYSSRARAIAERANVVDFLLTDKEKFIRDIEDLESELYQLWQEKRFVLTQLKGSYEWSWAGPRIQT
jgi:hypothetical protein